MGRTGGFLSRHQQIYLYVPNLIGYARLLFSLYAFAVALWWPEQCVFWYFLGFVCDELDGRFARQFNQMSTLGGVLDMVTDRLSTAGLLSVLGALWPRWHFCFLSLAMLDIFSHWFQMYASLVAGAVTHKDVHSRSFLVAFYYRHRLFMGFCCVACETLYLALYLLAWPLYQTWPTILLRPPAPLQRVLGGLCGSGSGVPVACLVAALSVPGFAIKQVINVVQLRSAMEELVQYDLQRERGQLSRAASDRLVAGAARGNGPKRR